MEAALSQLRLAVAGLLYPSESDEPFEVFTLPATEGSSRAAVAARATANANAMSEQTLEAFFGELVDDDQAIRFESLRKVLESNLSGLGVFRVTRGSEVDVYIVGRALDGAWIGLKTLSVET